VTDQKTMPTNEPPRPPLAQDEATEAAAAITPIRCWAALFIRPASHAGHWIACKTEADALQIVADYEPGAARAVELADIAALAALDAHDVLLRAIQRLNQNPYSLTKSECISELGAMRKAEQHAASVGDRCCNERQAVPAVLTDDQIAAAVRPLYASDEIATMARDGDIITDRAVLAAAGITAPAVPLTREEASDLWHATSTEMGSRIINFARAVERHHGITGAPK
jgi:hypothetical protein